MTTTEIALTRATAGSESRSDEIADLVGRSAAGDRAAWNELIDRFSALVWGVTRQHRLPHSDAADVFQTVWLRLVEHIDDLAEPRALGSWLATTTRRECLRLLRAARWQIPVGDELPERTGEEPEIDAPLLRCERDAMLWQAFARLSRRDQDLLRMLVEEPQRKYAEIAAALGVPKGSVGPTRRRCLERLRRECESQARRGATSPSSDGGGQSSRGSA